MIKYKNYTIKYCPKPGDPNLSPDFDFIHDDYEGDDDPRIGSERTVKKCMEIIDFIENDRQQSDTASMIAITVIAISLTIYILFWSL